MSAPTRLHGGCHCGAVRYEVTARERVAYTCNCSICRMKGFVHLLVPKSDFDLVSGAGDLVTYSFNTHTAKHLFCRTCGVQSFYVPRSHPRGISVNVNCLDSGRESFELRHFDGANWEDSINDLRQERP